MQNTLTPDTALLTFDIDSTHSQIGFKVRHLGFSKVRGRFEAFSGTVNMTPEALHTLKAEAIIDTASVNTGDAKRDEHLQSGDFFDSGKYPKMSFRSTAIRHAAVNTFALDGELSLHGITRVISLDGVYLGEAVDPWGNRRIAFEAVTKINRKDFGLGWNQVLEAGGLLVGEEIEISLEIQAILQK